MLTRSIASLLIMIMILGFLPLDGVYGWGNGSSVSRNYPYYGIHDAIADYAYKKLYNYNVTIAKWITDYYLDASGSKWGDYGYSFGQGSDNWLGYTDDPDSYYHDWDNHLYEVHGTRRNAPNRISQLYGWVVANLTAWIKAGMPKRSEEEHKAAYAAGLLSHYLADLSQFGHTDYTKQDHTHPSYDPMDSTYHGYYESTSINDYFLNRLTSDLESYEVPIGFRIENISDTAIKLAEWVNLGPDGRATEYVDIDGSIKIVGSNYKYMITNFVVNYDSGISYLNARGYNSAIYDRSLENIKYAVNTLANILYSAFKDAEENIFNISTQNSSLTRTPLEVHSWQPAFIFTRTIGASGNIALNITIRINATAEPCGIISLPTQYKVTYRVRMLPVPWAPGWYMTAIPGLPAQTKQFQYGARVTPTHIVINEVELNPSGTDAGNEWVELYNPTENSVDIGGWTLSTTHGVTVTLSIPPGTFIAPNGYYVVTYGKQWLDNELESVILRDSKGNEVDRTPSLTDEYNDGRSWQRYPNGKDTDSILDWRFQTSTRKASNGGEAELPTTITLKISSDVHYGLLINDVLVAEDGYAVLEGEAAKRLPPLTYSMVYDALRDPTILEETLGLGPRGWTIGGGMAEEVLIIALDDKGFRGAGGPSFEYRVDEGPWVQAPVYQDPLGQALNDIINGVNSYIGQIEDAVRKVKPDFELPELLRPIIIAYAEVPGQAAGSHVLFRSNAADIDNNISTSPMGFYHVVNRESSVRVLIVDPHVWLWLLQENIKQMAEVAKQNINYELPSNIKENLTYINKIADAVRRYGITPFHHWEYLGKHYNLYIAWPDDKLLREQSEGGFEPNVIYLSNLWLGLNETGDAEPWNWDLGYIKVNDETVLENLIEYVKDKHAGLIASHGTLSDWVIWKSPESSGHIKVECRGYIGESIEDLNIMNETTISAILGLPELALWEYARDRLAYALCTDPNTEPLGLLVGSTPLQVPYVPFNGTMLTTDEAKHIGWDLPKEFTISIPSIYNELGFNAYTEVGWQLAMPRSLAYMAWSKANETRPQAGRLHAKPSELVENVTSKLITYENATRLWDESLMWGLREFYRSMINASIVGNAFNTTLNHPNLNESLKLWVDIGREGYERLLQLFPAKLVALSKDGLSAIISHDKYWTESGYRSVYFSFEAEAVEGEIAERLLKQAVNWTTQWNFKNTTTILKNVRVPIILAESLNRKLASLPGNLTFSNGVLLIEDGSTTITFNASRVGYLHTLIAHPTSSKVGLAKVEGGEVVSLENITEGLTYIKLRAGGAGTIKLSLKADPELSLNPAYVAVKEEAQKPPSFVVGGLSIKPSEVSPGESVRIYANVTNIGDASGIYIITLKINGTVETTKSVALAGGESTTIMFEVIRELPGAYLVEVDGHVETFTVRRISPPPKARFEIMGFTISPTEAGVGENIIISFTVRNTGGERGLYTVVLKINGIIEDKKDVSLNAGESTFITFKVNKYKAGTYRVEIDGSSGIFLIKAQKAAQINITGLSIEPNEINIGGAATLTANITNIGEIEGTRTITLKVDGTVKATKEVIVPAGSSTSITFTVTGDTAGTHQIEVDGQAILLTVKEVSPPPPAQQWLSYIAIAITLILILSIMAIIIQRRK